MTQYWPSRENPSGLDVIAGQLINFPTTDHESCICIADIEKFLTAAIYNTREYNLNTQYTEKVFVFHKTSVTEFLTSHCVFAPHRTGTTQRLWLNGEEWTTEVSGYQ